MIDARSREISADYPGSLARLVEKDAGGFCLFLQGAQGDLSANPPMGVAGPEKFGEELGRLVLTQSKKIRCEMADVADLKVRERDFKFTSRVDLGNPLVRAAYSLAFFPEFVSFYEREYREGVRPHLTTALLDGRIGFVGVSGEFFCEHANHLRRAPAWSRCCFSAAATTTTSISRPSMPRPREATARTPRCRPSRSAPASA